MPLINGGFIAVGKGSTEIWFVGEKSSASEPYKGLYINLSLQEMVKLAEGLILIAKLKQISIFLPCLVLTTRYFSPNFSPNF